MLLTPHVYAQRTTGDLLGVVKDSSGAVLPGVSVSVTGPNIAGRPDHDHDGERQLPHRQSASGHLHGDLRAVRVQDDRAAGPSGRRRRQRSSRTSGSRLVRWPRASTSPAESPVVDTTSSEVGTTFDKDWVANAPSRRFGFYDLLAQAPGTVKGRRRHRCDRERRTMSFGSSFDENAFQLDGVNVTDNYFSEGFSEPNPDAIDEVEVLSLGAPAEYGNLMGAVYNIVTKQGTNQFHGDASYFFQSNGLTSNNTKDVKFPNDKFADACADDPTARCPWTRGDYYEATAQLGGPILRDRLWFFGSYGHQKDAVHARRRELQASGQRERHQERSGSRERDLADDARPAARRQLPSATSRRRDTGYSFNETPSTAWTRTQKAPTPGVAYTATLSNRTLLDVRYSGFYGGVTGYPSDPSQPLSQPRIYNGETGTISGGNYYWYFYDASRTTATGKLSHHADSFLGAEQDFHFGVQYNQAGVSGVYGYNDFIYTYLSGGKLYGYGNVRQTFSYAATARNIGAFVDDSIRLGSRVTLNLGVRFDHSKAFAPPQDELDDNAQPDRQDISACGFLHVGQRVTPAGSELEAHRRRQDDRQGTLGPLPSANHHRRVRQHHRSQRQAVLSGDLQPCDRPDRGSVPDEQQREPERGVRLQPAADRSVHRRVRARAEREDGAAGELRAQMGTRLPRLARLRGHLRPGAGRRQLGQGSDRQHDQHLPVDERPGRTEIRVGELRRFVAPTSTR